MAAGDTLDGLHGCQCQMFVPGPGDESSPIGRTALPCSTLYAVFSIVSREGLRRAVPLAGHVTGTMPAGVAT